MFSALPQLYTLATQPWRAKGSEVRSGVKGGACECIMRAKKAFKAGDTLQGFLPDFTHNSQLGQSLQQSVLVGDSRLD